MGIGLSRGRTCFAVDRYGSRVVTGGVGEHERVEPVILVAGPSRSSLAGFDLVRTDHHHFGKFVGECGVVPEPGDTSILPGSTEQLGWGGFEPACYRLISEVVTVTDVLIRGVAAHDLARIDERAARLGLSRGEYLRRRITQDANREEGRLTVADLHRAAELTQDLLDEDVMRDAWS